MDLPSHIIFTEYENNSNNGDIYQRWHTTVVDRVDTNTTLELCLWKELPVGGGYNKRKWRDQVILIQKEVRESQDKRRLIREGYVTYGESIKNMILVYLTGL